MDVQFDLLESIVENYNQMIDNLSIIISNFQFTKTYTDKSSKQILVRLLFSNPQVEETEKYSIFYMMQRQKDFIFKIKFDINYQFILQGEKVIIVNVPNRFYVIVPILTGSKYDPYIKLSQQSTKGSTKDSTDLLCWNKGVDINQTKADLILSGIPYFVQNIYSYPNNKPTIVPNDKDNLIASAQFMKQDDPIFGNTYYSRISIYKTKTGEETFVLVFKQFDSRFRETLIPMKWLLYLYGAKNDLEILQLFPPTDIYFLNYLISSFRVNPKHYLGEEFNEQDNQFVKRLKDIKQLLVELLRKNQNVTTDDLDQAMQKYLGQYSKGKRMLYQFTEIMRSVWYANKFNAYTDRDDLKNKRVQTMGIQFVGQLRSCLNSAWAVHMKLITQQLHTVDFLDIPTFEQLIKDESERMSETLALNIIKSISSASDENLTPLQKTLNDQKSRTQDIMQKRQIVLRLDSMGGKISYDQRKVQQSQYGFLCPITTPEYQCGRYISPTIYCQMTNAVGVQQYSEFVHKQSEFHEDSDQLIKQQKLYIPVKINYLIEGFVEYSDAKKLYKKLLQFRQSNPELQTTSVYLQIENEMRNPIAELTILTDIGRLIIPIYKTKTIPKSYTIKTKSYSEQLSKQEIQELFNSGELFWMCPEMSQNFIINEWPDLTAETECGGYKEYIQQTDILTGEKVYYFTLPFGLLGEIPSINPLVQMMKGVRESYMTGQIKQNISSMYTNFMNQFGVNMFVMQRPQTPPVHSLFEKAYRDFREHPTQQLLYITFKPQTFNQEDAIVANAGYFLRGGSRNLQYLTYTTYLENSNQHFPQQTLPKYGQQVYLKDVLIRKVEVDMLNQSRDMFVKFNYQRGIISNIRLNDKDGNKLPDNDFGKCYEIIIRIQIRRGASQGDKFVSRNCQKGTVGKLEPEYNMDIFENGICSSFVFSTVESVMKRETYGQVAEPCLNRYAAEKGLYEIPISMYQKQHEILRQIAKIQPQVCYSSFTGKKLYQSSILGGPINYGSQIQLVDLKLYARDFGPISKQTRHATKGRKRAGGLSLGNLEQTCFNAAGAFNYLKDTNNTNTFWYICPICGQSITTYKRITQDDQHNTTEQYICQLCGPQAQLIQMGNNFMAVALQQILYGSGINIVFNGKNMQLDKK